MCTTMMVVAMGMQAGNALQQSQNEKAFGEFQQKQAEADDATEQSAARAHARKIRKAGATARDQARAGYAGAGVDVDSASALQIDQQIDADYEADALTSIYTGQNVGNARLTEGRYAAGQARTRGRSALMQGAANAASGWSNIRATNQRNAMADQRRTAAVNRARG